MATATNTNSNTKQTSSPLERARLFAQATRQYEIEQPSKKWVEGETIRFDFPKTRFLSKVYLRIKGTFTAKHASKTTFTKSVFDMYNILRQLRLEINNGFNPYQISGANLSLYNSVNRFEKFVDPSFNQSLLGNTVSSTGASNSIQYTLELPLTLNDRETVGLILLQNDETNVTLEVDCDLFSKIATDTDIVFDNVDISVTPVLETFSIPRDANMIPDYSVIKMVNQQTENIVAAGETTLKLPTGLTYRKILLYIAKDVQGTPIEHDKIKDFQIILNQSDRPYSVSADHLAYKNARDYGGALPQGCYVFDFSSQGLANMGGGRDYIDTSKLMEFWVKINFKDISGNSNYVYTISEKLARMV